MSDWLDMRGDESASAVRLRVRALAADLGLAQVDIDRLALAASELSFNQIKHAVRGRILVRGVRRGDHVGLEILAHDDGPGIDDPPGAMRGTHGSSGLGVGIGVVRRQTHELDLDVRHGEATHIAARRFDDQPARHFEVAIEGRPHPLERVSGDDAVVVRFPDGLMAAVIDGVGHGGEAHDAARRAAEVIAAHAAEPPEAVLAHANTALKGTRGAAATVARLLHDEGRILVAGVGNVSARLHFHGWHDTFLSTAGVLGRMAPNARIRVSDHPLPRGATLLMFTDGIPQRTNLDSPEMVVPEHPAMAAHHLLKHARDRDDALVLVAR